LESTHGSSLALLSAAVDHAGEIVIAVDPQGAITVWNHAAATITGVAREEALGRALVGFFAPAHRTVTLRLLQQHALALEMVQLEMRIGRGKYAPFLWRVRRFLDQEGAIAALLLYGTALTLQAEHDLLIDRTMDHALIGLIANGIGHDLRNPLGVALASSQLLMQQGADPAFVRACAERIERALVRAAKHLDRFVGVVRPAIAPVQPLDLRDHLQSMIDVLQQPFAERDMTIASPGSLPPVVMAISPEAAQQITLCLGVIVLRLAARGAEVSFAAAAQGGSVQLELRIAPVERGARTIADTLSSGRLPTSVSSRALDLLICRRALTKRGVRLRCEAAPDLPSQLLVTCDLPANTVL
jgi:PAS domain S-box-containing protein